MNRYFFLTFAFLPLLVIGGVLLLYFFEPGRGQAQAVDADGIDKELALYREVRQLLLTRHDDSPEADDLLNGALKGMAVGTDDRYTRVNPPVEAKAQERELRGGFFGVGASVHANEDGSILIRGVVQGGPGDSAGLEDGDVVIAVDGESILGLDFQQVVEYRIKGDKEGSVVVLTVLRGGDPHNGADPAAERLDIPVARGSLIDWTVHQDRVEERHGKRFGYLRVSNFSGNTFDPQFREAIAGLTAKGIEGLVLDLRGNTGGRVKAAVELVDSLLTEENALVVFTRSNREENRSADSQYRTGDAEALTSLPLVALVDRGSASAAEIVAGALKDSGRALLLGERTFGKGVVQNIVTLETDPRYTVNITTTQYFTPLGRRVQNGRDGERGGVEPHIRLPYRDEAEYDLVRTKLALGESRLSEEALLDTDYRRKAWQAEDRMLEAALDLLGGRGVNVSGR